MVESNSNVPKSSPRVVSSPTSACFWQVIPKEIVRIHVEVNSSVRRSATESRAQVPNSLSARQVTLVRSEGRGLQTAPTGSALPATSKRTWCKLGVL